MTKLDSDQIHVNKDQRQPKYFIHTYGCQANIADSNTISGVLEALDYERVTALEDLNSEDIFIVNTCSVRQKSEDKTYGLGQNFAGPKAIFDEATKPFCVMAGCMVGSVTGERQRDNFNSLKQKTPWVDAYINPSQILELPQILAEKGILNEWALQKFNADDVVATQQDTKHAFVNISYGCDNFCTFCVVPYSRGKEVSRSKEKIIAEINHLVKRGYSHITLCGQNVNSWGLSMAEKFDIRTGSDQKLPFAQLLRTIHEINEIEKIDFISSNPFDFTNDLIDTMSLPKISNYLHMAIQSGNNEILKKMNRRHTIEDFENLVKRLVDVNPQLELGTDVIVGFPGESEEQFMDTVSLFKRIPFRVAYISIYSPRKGTPAQRFFEDDVALTEKKRRHSILMSVWQDTRYNKFDF